jgi:hypothetical protein
MGAHAYPSTVELAWRKPLRVRETPPEYVFHRPRLYLETTIPSYLTARLSKDLRTAQHQRATSMWWNSWRTSFEIYVSEHVIAEASKGDPEAAKRRLDLVARYPTLETDDRSDTLAERLIATCHLPARAEVDAAHVAIAAAHSMKYLLTWNCAHLVNPQFTPKIAAACEAEGYVAPILCTPETLTERHEYGRTG